LFFVGSASAFSQTWLWAKKYGEASWDNGTGIITDYQGNLYFSGQISDSAYFDLDTIVNQANFLCKYDSLGNEIWLKIVQNNSSGYPQLDVDENNNIYYYTTLTADTTIIDTDTLFNDNGVLGIIKFNKDGDLIWSKNFITNSNGSLMGIRMSEISVGDNQHVYLAGVFTDTAYFETDTLIPNSGGMFVLNLDENGNEIWVSQIGSTWPGTNYNFIDGLTTAPDETVYASGRFQGTAIFGTDTIIAQSNWADAFIAKIDQVGNCTWVQHDGGITPGPGSGMGAVMHSIDLAYDHHGALYSVGLYNVTCQAGDSILQNPLFISNSASFISKYDTSGQFIWARSFLKSEFYDAICDSEGDLYLIGAFADSIVMDTTVYSGVPSMLRAYFIARMDSLGNSKWVLSTGAMVQGSIPEISIGKCQSDRLYVACQYFSSPAFFGSITFPAPSNTDAIIACAQNFGNPDNNCFFASWDEPKQQLHDLIVFPNPASHSVTFLLENSQESIEQVILFDLSGRALLTLPFNGDSERSISLENIPAGVYFYSVQKTSGEFISGKLIVQ
jgi:hypothetical protein